MDPRQSRYQRPTWLSVKNKIAFTIFSVRLQFLYANVNVPDCTSATLLGVLTIPTRASSSLPARTKALLSARLHPALRFAPRASNASTL